VIPGGNELVAVNKSPACGFVSVMVAEAISVLPKSGSPMSVSVSAIATGVPFSVNVVR
jgi:hypothetical protein